MQRCDGTTSEDACENLRLREKIATSPDVSTLFNVYQLEDGAIVRLDRDVASNHVKTTINEMKKTGVKRTYINLAKIKAEVCIRF